MKQLENWEIDFLLAVLEDMKETVTKDPLAKLTEAQSDNYSVEAHLTILAHLQERLHALSVPEVDVGHLENRRTEGDGVY